MIALENHKADLISFFRSQPLAVLATHNKGQPYGSLVAFAATHDLDYLIFSTTRSTRKFANLSADPRVAMVIDNRGCGTFFTFSLSWKMIRLFLFKPLSPLY
jgi:nitroimidazol reductase NimA-like FMN-containing flavoprotein (pyridoxamine 5'-phosphate oxidase superfamily)